VKRCLHIGLFVVAALSAFAQTNMNSQGGNFKGQVRYENNTPASYVKVEIWTDGGTYRTTVNTDDMGHFAVQAPFAVIQYKIEIPGFKTAYGREDISTSGRAQEDITLKAMPGTNIPGAAPPAALDARLAAIPENAKKQFDAGQEALSSNALASAAQHFQQAAALYPNYAEAYQLLGLVQLQTAQKPADLQAAEASELKAITIEKNLPNAYYVLGLVRAMMGNTPAAEEPFTTFVTKDPNNPEGHFELAKTEFALNKFSEAELHARKAIELKEKNPGVEVVLAYSLLRQKKATEAKAAFQQYLQLDPNSPMKADVQKTIAMIDEHEKQEKQAK